MTCLSIYHFTTQVLVFDSALIALCFVASHCLVILHLSLRCPITKDVAISASFLISDHPTGALLQVRRRHTGIARHRSLDFSQQVASHDCLVASYDGLPVTNQGIGWQERGRLQQKGLPGCVQPTAHPSHHWVTPRKSIFSAFVWSVNRWESLWPSVTWVSSTSRKSHPILHTPGNNFGAFHKVGKP